MSLKEEPKNLTTSTIEDGPGQTSLQVVPLASVKIELVRQGKCRQESYASIQAPLTRERRHTMTYELLQCSYCSGSGRRDGVCGICDGYGQIRMKTPFIVCMDCSGTGGNHNPCTTCEGAGQVIGQGSQGSLPSDGDSARRIGSVTDPRLDIPLPPPPPPLPITGMNGLPRTDSLGRTLYPSHHPLVHPRQGYDRFNPLHNPMPPGMFPNRPNFSH